MGGLELLDTITKINPWFRTGAVPDSKLERFHRREFVELIKTVNKIEMATLIIGGRRVGKSVLMYQTINHLLKNGVDPKRILFIQGDNPIFLGLERDHKIINTILSIYQKYILEENFDNLNQPIFILLDEAHALPGWQIEIKSLIDLKYPIKFFVTGSSSFELRRGSQNPLTGRVDIKVIPPFSFVDFVLFKISDLDTQSKLQEEILSLSIEFKKSLLFGDSQKAFNELRASQALFNQHHIKSKLDEYLYLGGFPWVVTHPKGDDIPKYLRDLLTTTISKDILTHVEAREPQAFERLMLNACLSVGSAIKYKLFADNLGIDERTVSKYIDYYVESHWVFISSPYAFHQKADSIKSDKKIYIIDSGIVNALSFKDESELSSDRQYRSKVIENVIHNHLLLFIQSFGMFQSSVPFWLEEKSKKEIDFILEIKNGVIPIEVKCKRSLEAEDYEATETFLKTRSSAKFGIITTEDTLQIKNRILIVPYGLLLLLL